MLRRLALVPPAGTSIVVDYDALCL